MFSGGGVRTAPEGAVCESYEMKAVLIYGVAPLVVLELGFLTLRYAWGRSPALVVGILAALLVVVVVRGFFSKRADPAEEDLARGWRVGRVGRDEMFYEEFSDGTWQRITLYGDMLCGAGAHHVIYFPSPGDWESMPGWARGRRDEIISRMKSVLSPPGYEYAESGRDAS